MKVHTDYLWFTTEKRHQFVNITDDVAAIARASRALSINLSKRIYLPPFGIPPHMGPFELNIN